MLASYHTHFWVWWIKIGSIYGYNNQIELDGCACGYDQWKHTGKMISEHEWEEHSLGESKKKDSCGFRYHAQTFSYSGLEKDQIAVSLKNKSHSQDMF